MILERKNVSLSGENFEDLMSFTNSIKNIMAYFLRFKDELKQNIEDKNSNFTGLLVDILTFNMLKLNNKKDTADQQK